MKGLEIQIDARAVVVRLGRECTVLSSAPVRGGFGTARSIVNLRVPKNDPCEHPTGMIDRIAAEQDLAGPVVGLLTSVDPRMAHVEEGVEGERVVRVIVTAGLGNPVAAGRCRAVAALPRPATINLIALIDGNPAPAALVNAVATLTEVKVSALAASQLYCPDGHLATGTSTDAIALAASGRGERLDYGGPASDLGALLARTSRRALAVVLPRALDRGPRLAGRQGAVDVGVP